MAKKRARKTSAAGQRGESAGGRTPDHATGDAADDRPEQRAAEVHVLARLHIWQVQAFRDVLVVAALVGVFWFGYVLRTVTVPLLVALLLAYLFEPVVSRLTERRDVSLAAAVAGLLGCMVAAVVLVAALVLPLVVGSTVQLVSDVRSGVMREKVAKVVQFLPEAYQAEFSRALEVLPGTDGPLLATVGHDGTEVDGGTDHEAGGGAGATEPAAGGADAAASVAEGPAAAPALTEQRVREIVDEAVRQAGVGAAPPRASTDWLGLARGGSRTMARVVGAVLSAGLVTFLIPFYFFFFSLWYPAVLRFLRGLLPESNRARSLELLAKMDRVVSGFVRGRIIISLIMGVLLAIGWWTCGVPYAPVVGLVIGVFCAVPYLGAIGVPLAVGLLFFERLGTGGGSWWWVGVVVWPTLVFVVVQAIEGWILTPAIAGKVTNLDPVTVLVAVLAGGSVLGIYGMLLAIPVAACLKILVTDVLLPKIHAWTRGEADDPLPIGKA